MEKQKHWHRTQRTTRHKNNHEQLILFQPKKDGLHTAKIICLSCFLIKIHSLEKQNHKPFHNIKSCFLSVYMEYKKKISVRGVRSINLIRLHF